MEVHRILGPGFLEAVYQAALEHEFTLRGIPYEAQKRLVVTYKGQFAGEYVADLVVAREIILELKAVSALNKALEAQAHNYLAATGLHLAILINFGAASSRANASSGSSNETIAHETGRLPTRRKSATNSTNYTKR